MNYTLRDICDMQNDFAERMGGNYRGAPEMRDQARQIDWAMTTIAQVVRPMRPGIQVFLRENVSEYRLDSLADFARRILTPVSFTIGGRRIQGPPTVSGATPSGLFTLAEAESDLADWLTSETQREKAVLGGNNNVYIVPAPNGTVLDRGAHSVDAVYIPGWILSDGTYWPGGPPLGQDDAIVEPGAGSSTSVTDENGAGTAAEHALSGDDGTVSNANNAKVDDTSVATISQDFPMLDAEPKMLALSNFGFSIPSGATVTSVRVKSIQASSLDDAILHIAFVEDIGTSTSAIMTQTVSLGTAGTLAEFGPLPVVPGIDYPTLNDSSFGVVLSVWPSSLSAARVGGPPTTTTAADIDYLSIEVVYFTTSIGEPVTVEGAWGTGGTTIESTDWNAVPDMPEDVHPAIAVLAAYKAANPMASGNDAIDAIGRLVPDAMAAVKQYAARVSRATTSVVSTKKRFGRRIGC